MRDKPLFMFLFNAILLCMIHMSLVDTASARTVRIGLYDNPPKVLLTAHSAPAGIFVDIIGQIARNEGWELKYVNGTWEELLAMLDKGEIDLMPDVAYSELRAQRFDFNKLSVLASWLQFYGTARSRLDSISDLNGKTVAVLKDSIQHQTCLDLKEQFGLSLIIMALPDYDSTIQAVVTGRADAMLASRFYGYKRNVCNDLTATSIIFKTTTLHYAAQKGMNGDLLKAIDRHLARMMEDVHSVYYKSIISWLGEKPQTFIPSYIIWSLVSLCIVLLVLLVWGFILRRQVRKDARDIKLKNIELNKAMEEIRTVREDAAHRERLYSFGQLAYGAAHDFNNLLVPILTYSEMLLNTPAGAFEPVKARRYMQEINIAAVRGTEMVQRMQSYHRMTGEMEKKGPVDLNAMIRDVVEFVKFHSKVRKRNGQKGIEFILKAGVIRHVHGRSLGLHEILMNLMLNSIDAMPEGGPLEIITEDIGNEVRLTVQDRGQGMPEDVLKKCQQPFFSTKGAEGTGMGLSIVSNIVSEHGGRIEISSTPGMGTTVVINLPVANATG